MKHKNDKVRRLYVVRTVYEPDYRCAGGLWFSGEKLSPETHPDAFYEMRTRPHLEQEVAAKSRNKPLERLSSSRLRRRLANAGYRKGKLKAALLELKQLLHPPLTHYPSVKEIQKQFSGAIKWHVLKHFRPSFILIDEAWKLLKADESFRMALNVGRKIGHRPIVVE